ncbi:MAG: ABC transporter substrate-binding protein [Anaerolineaceae bacterium]
MKTRKVLAVISIIMIFSFVLSACAPTTPVETAAPEATEEVVATEAPVETEAPVATEEVVATEEPTEEPTVAPTTRKGGWLDEIVFTAIADAEPAVSQIQAGAIDIYPVTVDDPELMETVKNDPNLKYVESYGSFNQLMFNTVECKDTSVLNPFSNQKIREAMNWAVDREYISQEIMGGASNPRYTLLTTTFPDYARYAPIIGQLINKYKYNFDKAKEVVDAEMVAMGAEMGADGKWQYQGKPVTIIGLIRSEDKRKEQGDYFANQLEKLGFTVDRQFKVRSEAAPIWQGDPYMCEFTYYTAGWISTAIARDEGNMFAQYNTGRIQDVPLFLEYKPSPEYDEVLTKLQNNDFNSMEERDELFAKALPMSMEESWHGLMINDTAAFSPMNKDLVVASDLAAAVAGTAFWPLTMRWDGKEGGTVKIAQSGILVQPWNPIAGSNWTDDAMIQRATADSGSVSDPYTGLYLPQRIEKAEVIAQEGLPIVKSLDWVDLKFEPEITVPEDAWVDWDAVNQKFITAAEKFPDGVTAKTKTIVYYPSSLWETKWHDGNTISMGDFILHMILNFDIGKPESKIYDENYVPQLETFMSHFKGVKITSTDPLVIETYDDLYYLDAEQIAGGSTWYPSDLGYVAVYGYGIAPWQGMVPAMLAEENGELAFSEAKSLDKEVEYTSFIAGPSLEIQKKYLDQAAAESYIPYSPTMSEYVTKEEADARYTGLLDWYGSKGHLWVGTGPYYVDQVFPVEGTVTLKHFADFPDMADRWASFGIPKMVTASLDGPAIVKAGEEAVFDVAITFGEEPYLIEDLSSVTYWVTDATGALVAQGDAVAVEDGAYTVTLPADVTSKLSSGANMLSVAVASKVVSIPAFATFEFVSQ